MDLGLNGKHAIVCASSRGLGKACATALAREGCDVIVNGRDVEHLSATADEIARICGNRPRTVQADLNTAAGRAALLAACAAPDILVTNNAGPPPGMLGDWDRAAWISALEANLLAPIELISAVVGGMCERVYQRINPAVCALAAHTRTSFKWLMTPTQRVRIGPLYFCGLGRGGGTLLGLVVAMMVAQSGLTV